LRRSSHDPREGVLSYEFVGDLSVTDAKILYERASASRRILEFGVGGSTQIFAQCMPRAFVCVDTNANWIKRTKDNLSRISHDDWCAPQFVPYDFFKFEGEFDLIFVDGAPEKRLDFAMRAWPLLAVNGRMIFHDTRRFEYFREAAWVIQSFFNEVSRVSININESNLTVIEKGPKLVYENWNETEGKPAWAYGNGDIPEGESLWKIES
jgi:hypothetical protein